MKVTTTLCDFSPVVAEHRAQYSIERKYKNGATCDVATKDACYKHRAQMEQVAWQEDDTVTVTTHRFIGEAGQHAPYNAAPESTSSDRKPCPWGCPGRGGGGFANLYSHLSQKHDGKTPESPAA